MKTRSAILRGVLCGALWTLCAAPALAQPASSNELARLAFAPGSSALGNGPELRRAILWARTHPDGVIILSGHGDGAAGDERIALERARAVRGWLIAEGANPEQIVIAAFTGDGERSVVVWGSR